jgi:glycine/D-amino acid oxidase-like deaminating enzyme
VKEYPYWWDTTAAPEAESGHWELDGCKVDVAIVGAGYTGLAAARHLGRIGASAVVLDGDVVGAGASSRNGGQVLTGLKLDPATLVRRYGQARARQLFDISLESIARLEAIVADEAIDCELEPTGHIQAAAKPAHFEAFREEQALLARVFDHRVELVSERDQASELGTRRYHGLIVDERSVAVNPAQYVNGLAQAADRARASIVTRAPVNRIVRKGKRWRLSVGRFEVDAGDVLVATNGYTSAISPGLQRRLVPIGSYVIATEPLPEATGSRLLPHRRVAFDSKYFLYYFRLTSDGRLLFGGRAEFSEPGAETTRRAAGILRRGMLTVFPELADIRIDYAWGGSVAFTRDEMPHAGQLDGLYYAGGYCGHGIAMATYLGELIARRMAGELIAHELLDTSFPSFPLYRGTPWFLPLVGAYYRMKDWLQ